MCEESALFILLFIKFTNFSLSIFSVITMSRKMSSVKSQIQTKVNSAETKITFVVYFLLLGLLYIIYHVYQSFLYILSDPSFMISIKIKKDIFK